MIINPTNPMRYKLSPRKCAVLKLFAKRRWRPNIAQTLPVQLLAKGVRDDQKLPNLGTQDGVFHPKPEPTAQMVNKCDLDKVTYYVPVCNQLQTPCYQRRLATYTEVELA